MSKLAIISFATLATLSITAQAHAKGAVCERVQGDMFTVDGMSDDWEAFSPTRFGRGPDAGVELRCAYDDQNLYVAFAANDERIVRSKKARPRSEDRLSLSLSSGIGKALKFEVLPGGLNVPRKNLGVPSFVELEDSRQERGFLVELAIPLRKIPGWSPTVPYLAGSIRWHDVDLPSDGKAQSVVGMRGKLHFSEAVDTYKTFMKTTGLRNRDVRLDALADVDLGAGAERVIVGGKVIGILGTRFSFMGLPIASPSDLLSAKIVDFDGGGRHAIVTELRQHGNGGSRDVLMVWFARGDGNFQPALTVETRKQRGDSFLANTWALVPREQHRQPEDTSKKRRKKSKKRAGPPGFDLLMQVGEISGFDQSNFREAPSPDAKNILLPWGEQQSAVYFLEGDVAYGGDAATNLP